MVKDRKQKKTPSSKSISKQVKDLPMNSIQGKKKSVSGKKERLNSIKQHYTRISAKKYCTNDPRNFCITKSKVTADEEAMIPDFDINLGTVDDPYFLKVKDGLNNSEILKKMKLFKYIQGSAQAGKDPDFGGDAIKSVEELVHPSFKNKKQFVLLMDLKEDKIYKYTIELQTGSVNYQMNYYRLLRILCHACEDILIKKSAKISKYKFNPIDRLPFMEVSSIGIRLPGTDKENKVPEIHVVYNGFFEDENDFYIAP